MAIICIVLLAFQFVFILRIAMSFFPLKQRGTAAGVRDLAILMTDPVVLPLRRKLPPLPGALAGFGVAEIAVILALFMLTAIFC